MVSDKEALSMIRQQGWYINNAMRQKIDDMQKSVDQAKESMKHDDGNDVYRSMQGIINEIEWALVGYRKAQAVLKELGID